MHHLELFQLEAGVLQRFDPQSFVRGFAKSLHRARCDLVKCASHISHAEHAAVAEERQQFLLALLPVVVEKKLHGAYQMQRPVWPRSLRMLQ